MVTEKHNIIKSEGVPVRIERASPYNTVALVGRASSSNSTNAFSLESQRRGVFLPDTNISNGELVCNCLTNEHYLTIGVYPEIIQRELASYTSLLLRTNVEAVTVTYKKFADDKGNIKTRTDISEPIQGFFQEITDDLRQLDSGLYKDTDGELYISAEGNSVEENSQVKINKDRYKVLGVNQTSYEGLLVLNLGPDIRE